MYRYKQFSNHVCKYRTETTDYHQDEWKTAAVKSREACRPKSPLPSAPSPAAPPPSGVAACSVTTPSQRTGDLEADRCRHYTPRRGSVSPISAATPRRHAAFATSAASRQTGRDGDGMGWDGMGRRRLA